MPATEALENEDHQRQYHRSDLEDVRVPSNKNNNNVLANMWWIMVMASTILVLWITDRFRQLVAPKSVSKNQLNDKKNFQEEFRYVANGTCEVSSSDKTSTIKSKDTLNGEPYTNGVDRSVNENTTVDNSDVTAVQLVKKCSVTDIQLVNGNLKNCESKAEDKYSKQTTEVVEEIIQTKILAKDVKKIEDVIDSGGEYNDDTDTETITSENTEELSSSSSSNKGETELEPASESLESSSSQVSELNDCVLDKAQVVQSCDEITGGGVNEQPTRPSEKMELFDDHDLPKLATQITVGEVNTAAKFANARVHVLGTSEKDFEKEDDEEEGGMSHVLRINTADEHNDHVIHSTNWEEAEDECDSTTTDEERSKVYTAKCVDVSMETIQTPATEVTSTKETEKTQLPNDGEESVTFDSESLLEIEVERRRIIANQVVRGKWIDTWLTPENDATETSTPEVLTAVPKIEVEQVPLEPSTDEAFLAVPVLLECQQATDNDGDPLYVTQERLILETRQNAEGEAEDGNQFSEEQLISEMTSVETQPQSLDASDYNHEPDSLDLVPENEDYQNVQPDTNSQLNEEQNAKDYNNIDCSRIARNNMASESPVIDDVAYLDHGDAKNKATMVNGSLTTASWQESHGAYVKETIIDREVRLALEREEEFRKELSMKSNVTEPEPKINGTMNVQERPNNVAQTNDQSAYFKTKVLSEIRSRDANMVLSMENGTRSVSNGLDDPVLVGHRDSANPLESVIQREIRQQKEREEALAQERQMAQMAAHMKTQLAHKPVLENEYNICSTNTKGGSKEFFHQQRYPQTIIDCDIREQRNGKLHNDEETWSQRQKFSANDSGIESPLNSDPCLIELGGGSSDGENSDGLLPVFHHHQRAESLDSLGSAGTPSSNSSISAELPLPRRQVKVKPLVDEEVQSRPTYQVLKESPIEREIRLAREREEALRREKGLPTPPPSSPSPTTPTAEPNTGTLLSNSKKQAASAAAASWVRSRAMDLNNPKEQRSVQWRLATSRIQQEIEEQTQRELALRATGAIRTTSEDHVDSKVTRLSEVLAESTNNSKFNHSPPSTPDSEHTDSSGSNTTPPSPGYGFARSPFCKTSTLPIQNNHPGRMFIKAGNCGVLNGSSSVSSTLPRRPLSGTGKGVMQKFIASRGKVIPSFTSPRSISTSNLNMYSLCDGSEASREQLMKEIRAPPPRNARRIYCSAETKIQKELQQMKVREEELRLVRAKSFAMSQPNLLSIDDDDDDGMDPSASMIGNPSLREKSSSNPNLLDEELPEMENQAIPSKPAVCRRRSALIAQWEEKIQQNSDN